MIFPGESTCREKLACKPQYDIEEIYHECVNGFRFLEYRWRKGTVCNTDKIVLPPPRNVECDTCKKGFYLSIYPKPECTRCPSGYFSDKDNSSTCSICPGGKYASPVEYYENMESFPNDFENSCEASNPEIAEVCSLNSLGWIVARKALTTLPSLPVGIKVKLRKNFKISQDQGIIEFSYISYDPKEGSEFFQVNIDGDYQRLPLGNKLNLMSKKLNQGFHYIEWTYEKLNDDPERAPIEIASIKIEGGSGSAIACTLCPNARFYLLNFL